MLCASPQSQGMANVTADAVHSNSSSRPRVVIVGAGMSGLSAARHLCKNAPDRFDITILEASERAGGRICSASFHGELVELGATWIHGIDGSPIHEIAQRMHLMLGESPWECMDGFPEAATVIAEGGSIVPSRIVNAIGSLYKKLYSEIQCTDGGLQQFSECESPVPMDDIKELRRQLSGASVGEYLWEGFRRYVAKAEHAICNGIHSNGYGVSGPNSNPMWTAEAFQEGVFRMRENLERSVTAAASMNDLDMDSNDEYWEYPGEHKTIGRGYSSVVQYFVSSLPGRVIQYHKQVGRITWLEEASGPIRIHCLDGSLYEADHVIVTVSLGILKTEVSPVDGSKQCQVDRLFHPPLPPRKLKAVSRLGFGVVDKCFLYMKPTVQGATYPHVQLVFKQDHVHDKLSLNPSIPWWMSKNFSFYPVHSRAHVVCTWFTGEEALEMERSSNEEVSVGILRTMKAFSYEESVVGSSGACKECNQNADGWKALHEEIQGVEGRNSAVVEGILRSQWGSNPLYRGSYSYVAVGSSGEDIDVLAEPLPQAQSNEGAEALNHRPLQLLFAGEATHRHCYSTTHGAYLSGVREAERLIRHYGLATARAH